MNLNAALSAEARQKDLSPQKDGGSLGIRASRLGQLMTVNWRQALILAGKAYNVTVGDISAGAAESLITGGGAGATIDSDQPEMAVGVPAGYYLIPMRFQCSARVDLDADAETGEILLFADTTQNIPLPIAASSTVETPANLLGGGEAFPGYAQSAVTTDITDPLMSVLLLSELIRNADNGTAGSASFIRLNALYEPLAAPIFKGPCSIIACWGGTAAVTAAATFDFAAVPASWVE